jgi:hypothetical protein
VVEVERDQCMGASEEMMEGEVGGGLRRAHMGSRLDRVEQVCLVVASVGGVCRRLSLDNSLLSSREYHIRAAPGRCLVVGEGVE